MILYHGSSCEVRSPDLNLGRLNLDFGKGFYATDLQEQAEKWALRKRYQNDSAAAVISVYEFDETSLIIRRFDGYSEEWLDYIVSNRGYGVDTIKADVIIGNVADDEVVITVNDYIRLLEMNRATPIQKSATLEQLSYSKPSNQVCFKSERALSKLKFINSYIRE